MLKMFGELKTAFCGCNLRTGVSVIGTLHSITAFMIMILTAAYSEHPQEFIDMSDDTVAEHITGIRIYLICFSIICAIHVVFSILIIFGAQTNRPVIFLPWLGFYSFILTLSIMGIIGGIIHNFSTGDIMGAIGNLLAGSVGTTTGLYMIAVVYSFYNHLKRLNF